VTGRYLRGLGDTYPPCRAGTPPVILDIAIAARCGPVVAVIAVIAADMEGRAS
jgi:hypothetical protein